MNDLTALSDWAQVTLWTGFLVFLRVGAIMAVMPAFGERVVPARIKLVVALAFTFIVAPAAAAQFDLPPQNVGTMARFAVTEVIVGLALGLAIRLFILAVQTAGSIAAQATSLAQVLGGSAAEPMPAIGHVLTVGALALAVMTGLHVKAAAYIIFSYDVLPAGRFADAQALSAWGTHRVAQAFGLAFSLAAPFIIISVIYNLTLGVINKAMPQLMVAFVGAPVITLGGLFVLFAMSPMILSVWADALDSFFTAPFEMR